MSRESARSNYSHSGAQTRGVLTFIACRRQAGTRHSRMKLERLLRHLRRQGCVLRREGKEHALWEEPQTGSAALGLGCAGEPSCKMSVSEPPNVSAIRRGRL